MSAAGFRKQLAVIGEAAAFPFPVHPHMLRHACGFALAHARHDTRAIQEWLGHRNIQHTTRYTVGSIEKGPTRLVGTQDLSAPVGVQTRCRFTISPSR